MEREMMLQKLMELDFLAVDLGLYLNTHPTETEAINAYNQTIEAADTLRMKFEAAYGPLCSFRSYAADTENWQTPLWLERSACKCGFMKRNYSFL